MHLLFLLLREQIKESLHEERFWLMRFYSMFGVKPFFIICAWGIAMEKKGASWYDKEMKDYRGRKASA